jgi:RNA polymerase sigma-70 factor (ECF subfamily)
MSEMAGMLPVKSIFGSESAVPLSAKTQEDLLLVRRAQQGDLAAFNQLVLAHQDAVYRQACWILGDAQAAEDAAQEAFLRAYRKLDTFNGTSFRAWVLRIAINYCLDRTRWHKCHPSTSLDVFSRESEEENENTRWLRDPQPTPEQVVEQAELNRTVMDCLQKLAPEYRIPLVLIEVEELDYQEAAQVMGLPLGSFKSRVFRARAKLLEAVKRCAGLAG